METTLVHWVNIGIMENKMETTLVHWVNIGIMENCLEVAGAHRVVTIELHASQIQASQHQTKC